MPKALTANRLRDGEVVYLTASGNWAEDFKSARTFAEESDGQVALQKGHQDELRQMIVHAYLFELTSGGEPKEKRELIRAKGPTVRTDLGKQAR